MSDIQVISTTKDGTKIGDFNIKNSFLEQNISPYMPVKTDKDTSKINALLKQMSVPFGLVYLQTYGNHQTPLEEFENMDIHNISSSLHKLNAFNENSGINNNNNEHVADTKVMEQSLCDRLLGVVKAYEKEKKGKHEKNRENKNRENKKATRKIHHNKNKNNKNKNNKKTRKNNNSRN